MGQVFNAPLLGGDQDWVLQNTNLSELSSGYSVAMLAAVALIGYSWRTFDRATRWVIPALAVPTALWFAWCLLPWPQVAQHLPLLNRVMPVRAAQVVGLPACVLLAVVLVRSRKSSARFAVVVGAATSAMTVWAAFSLRRNYAPELSLTWPIVISVWVGVLIVWIILRPQSRWPAIVALALAAASVATINPVQPGLGDPRNSELARYLGAADDPGLWATDRLEFIAVVTASGVHQLSGMQITGPDDAGWLALDPDRRYVESWNRGASYIRIEFADSGELSMSTPTPDQLLITATPCELAATRLPVRHILTAKQLASPCAQLVKTVTWNDSPAYIDDVRAL